ncbi:MAG: enoyl-CoA hydratase/isomerase family protein [Thermodesulfobacteriota bacterium]
MDLVKHIFDGEILRISLNRPQALNAINQGILAELAAVIKKYAQDENVKALLLWGEGGCFSAGADIKELASFNEEGMRGFHHLREKTFALLEKFPAPSIALIERYALGTGLELALCCDMRLATNDAKLGVPSARLGLVESYEYFYRLVRAVGPSWAKRMVCAGEQIEAVLASQIGLLEEVSPPDKIFAQTEALLEKIKRNSLWAIRQTKRIFTQIEKDPHLRQVADPARPLVDSLANEFFQQATKSFLEKKKK